jgi:hypothetical protein
MTESLNKSIADYFTVEEIKRLTLPSNFRYGSNIYTCGAVEYISNEPVRVEAWVGGLDGTVAEGGGSRRRVEFVSSPKGLIWNCTGNPKNHQIFCKHCVALALDIINKKTV